MNTNDHPTLPGAAPRPSASPPLELLAARQARDGLATLLRAERTAAADFLLALADFDRRRGWEPLGHASLFAFLRVELGLSRSAAFWRLSAARLLQRFPEVIEPLREGRLCLSTTAELAKVLTEENLVDVLPLYFRLSAREAAEVTAALLPLEQPPLRAVVTDLRSERRLVMVEAVAAASPSPPAAGVVLAPGVTRTLGAVLTSEPNPTHPARVVAPRDDVEPLTADLRRLHVTVSRQFLKKLDAARDGLSHSMPGATSEQVLEAALDLLLEKQARARGQVKKPRTTLPGKLPTVPQTAPRNSQASSASGEQQHGPPLALVPAEPPPHRRDGPREAIPAAVRRAVWERDGGKCQWPLDSGGRCGSTHRLELDHIGPWGRFGADSVENLRLVCHRHNLLAARQAFGARCVERYAGVPGEERDGGRSRPR
jgi:HNH endonuclease